MCGVVSVWIGLMFIICSVLSFLWMVCVFRLVYMVVVFVFVIIKIVMIGVFWFMVKIV